MKRNNDDLTVVGAIIMAIIFCFMNIFIALLIYGI